MGRGGKMGKRTIPRGPMRDLIEEVVAAGCTVESVNKHIKVRCPNGRFVITSITPSDGARAAKNSRSVFRRYGVDV